MLNFSQNKVLYYISIFNCVGLGTWRNAGYTSVHLSDTNIKVGPRSKSTPPKILWMCAPEHTTFIQKNLTGVLLWNNTDDCKAWFTTSDISISTKSIRKQSMIYPLGRVNTKQREFFFVSSFVLLLAYASTMFLCLCICRSTCRRLDCIRLCFAFCLSLCLCR